MTSRVSVPTIGTAPRTTGPVWVWRMQHANFSALDAGGCKAANGRFHWISRRVKVLYCSLEPADCVHEVVGNMARTAHGLPRSEAIARIAGAVLPANMWKVLIPEGIAVLDLLDPETVRRVGVPPEYLVGTQDSAGDEYTREIGHQAYDRRYDYIRVMSVPGTGINMNLLLGTGQLPHVMDGTYSPVMPGDVPDNPALTPAECVTHYICRQLGL